MLLKYESHINDFNVKKWLQLENYVQVSWKYVIKH
jgi:hypothetical protein